MSNQAIHRRWTVKLKARREERKRAARRLVTVRRRVNVARHQVAMAVRVLKRHPLRPVLRLRAYREAVKLIGVVEQGGNNTGPAVDRIIRANGGVIGEPWCGDFMAYCYRLAGSQGVDRSWASVSLVGSDPDVIRITPPRKGDLVRYTFDHVGMFVKDNGDGTITTVEGNTTNVGAVSDSSNGNDGVKRKIRSKALVRDYLSVLR